MRATIPKLPVFTFLLFLALFSGSCFLAGCKTPPSPLQGRHYASKAKMALWEPGNWGRPGMMVGSRPPGTVFTVTGQTKDGAPLGTTAGIPAKEKLLLPGLPASGETPFWRPVKK